MITIGEHRSIVQSTLSGMNSGRVWRDVTPVLTPWGPIKRSAALYRRDAKGWQMVVDEFGAPTNYGREIYRKFAKLKTTKKLVRIANKNQLLVESKNITQLNPISWTTQFVELSVLYEFLRQSQLISPGLFREQDGLGNVILSRLVCLIGGDAERQELISGLQKLARSIEGLSQPLQALVLVFDSDLGKPIDPFIRINDRDPSEVNKVSMWRCWTSDLFLDDAIALLVPPVAVTGWDVYKRPVWAPSPIARTRQLCILEVDLPIESNPAFVIDHEQLWSTLQELMQRCRKDRDVAFRFIDGIANEDKVASFMQKAEFWLKFWSHHFQETLVGGDITPDRIYDVMTDGSGSSPLLQFERASSPSWEKGDSQTAERLLTQWCLPFCPTGKSGEWHESLEFLISTLHG